MTLPPRAIRRSSAKLARNSSIFASYNAGLPTGAVRANSALKSSSCCCSPIWQILSDLDITGANASKVAEAIRALRSSTIAL